MKLGSYNILVSTWFVAAALSSLLTTAATFIIVSENILSIFCTWNQIVFLSFISTSFTLNAIRFTSDGDIPVGKVHTPLLFTHNTKLL